MNREELYNRLLAEGVDPESFDVFGNDPHPIPGDIYVLRPMQSGIVGRLDYWVTYYSERGHEVNLQRFTSEDEACRSLLSVLKSGPTAAP